MRPVTVEVSAVGFSSWIPLDFRLVPFSVTLDVQLSDGANLTYTVEYTDDDVFDVIKPPVALSRAATVAALTFPSPHVLVPGDWIAVQDAGAPFDGDFAVATVLSTTQVTYAVVAVGPLTPARLTIVGVRRGNVRPHGGLTAQTATAVGAFIAPVRACRLNVTALTLGEAKMTVIQSGW